MTPQKAYAILKHLNSFPANMIVENLAKLNWVDLIMACIIMRCVFIGATHGLISEFFKLLGMLFATFVTLHYYLPFANFLHRELTIPLDVNQILSFSFLWFTVVVIFKVFYDGWLSVLRSETYPLFNKWGGIIMAIPRAALVCGMAFLLIFISGNENIIKQAKKSLVGFYLMDLSPYVYGSTFDNIVVRLFPNE